ncbi:MAG TPA: isocitrate/isopropylmalate family dehydrogenase [Actinocrinis sp.]|uniref:isocitrate/isopropylmalate dehydrogenase family protein n=1 Tax=Actinocrinis sp. TaxID=1920516 RepID=UPI002DDD2AEF|nr:isocitrate/isopropylmalate family dehydrogenase [Actinocrinis sp.]HEV2347692.1 isocitrate/isopropylmalate family dehydrogenase [Actinocrinis sp.]
MADGYNLALLPGDGIGVEVIAQARRVLEAVARLDGLDLAFDEIPGGARYFLEHGSDWPQDAAGRCAAADAILLGAIGWPSPDGRGTALRPDGKMAGWSAVVGNRIGLDLYANIRPVRLLPGVRHYVSGRHRQIWRPSDVDMVFIRENTEDLYSGAGGILAPGGDAQVAVDTRIITRRASERVLRLAFETASRPDHARKGTPRRVTCVVKDNILYGCRLFVRIFEEIGEQYPHIEREVVLVDAFTQWLVRRPEHYDVVVAPNMFGDIITELACALQGGVGMSAGCNVGERHGMFEPVHGSAPRHAGTDRANPMAAVLAAGEALRWLGARRGDERAAAGGDRIEAAVRAVLRRGRTLTYDLVGAQRASSTSAVGTAIIEALGDEAPCDEALCD